MLVVRHMQHSLPVQSRFPFSSSRTTCIKLQQSPDFVAHITAYLLLQSFTVISLDS